jgi:hypothetical protein
MGPQIKFGFIVTDPVKGIKLKKCDAKIILIIFIHLKQPDVLTASTCGVC